MKENKICSACASGHHAECDVHCIEAGKSFDCACTVCAANNAASAQVPPFQPPKRIPADQTEAIVQH